jgi:KH domain
MLFLFLGKLIGKNGAHINKLKAVTNCNIILKDLKDIKSQPVSIVYKNEKYYVNNVTIY